ncbi:MAG: tetratricopeptide repeat protein [Bacteroidia bacterium]|nr:tetratricopeptide repeat protein [Bacteroidia bacterium]
MKNVFLFVGLSILVLSGCGNTSKEKDLAIINGLEGRLLSDSLHSPKPALIDSLLLEYGGFALSYPEDSLSPLYLFKAGELSLSTNQGQKALGYFDQVVRIYPQHEKASFALFMKGFVCDGPLKDTAKARQFYTDFIQKYPQHPLVADAMFSVRNLGKSDEELIREFEAKLDSSGQTIP